MMLLGQESIRDAILFPQLKPKQPLCKGCGRPHSIRMSGIAEELDQKLRTLAPETAATVERLVREALQLANARQANGPHWPPGFWDQVRADWGNEPFERPLQVELSWFAPESLFSPEFNVSLDGKNDWFPLPTGATYHGGRNLAPFSLDAFVDQYYFRLVP